MSELVPTDSIPRERPGAPVPQVENIPSELRARAEWVLWRYVWREDRWRKVPVNCQGTAINAYVPANQISFSEAFAAYQNAAPEELDGVGFVLNADGPYAGLDLDDCRDPETGEISPDAQELIDRLGSYAEVSPSGTGIKVLCRVRDKGKLGRKPSNIHGVEFYTKARFFTVTGHVLPGFSEIRDCQAELEKLFPQGGTGAASAGSQPTDGSLVVRAVWSFLPKRAQDILSGKVETNDRSGLTYELARLCVEAGMRDAEAIANIVVQAPTHRQKFGDRVGGHDAWTDALAVAERALDVQPIPETPADEPAGLDAALSYDDWLKDVTPPQWCLQYFLAPGLLTTLVGDAGRGKSTFTGHLLARLLEGAPFLGLATATPEGRILVVSEEPRGVWLERPQLDSRVWFIGTDDLGNWDDFCADLGRGDHEFSLVIVDSFDAIFTGTSQSDAVEVNNALRPLSRAVRNRNLAVLVLDFLRKRRDAAEASAKDTAGSYAKIRAVDVLATLYEADADDASPRRTLAIKKSRFAVPPEWRAGIVIRLGGGQYERLGSAEELKADAWAAKQTAVLNFLFARGRAGTPWATPQEVDRAAGLTGDVRRQRNRLLQSINAGGTVVVDNGKRTVARRYALAQFVQGNH